jgi:hypothetical protein
MWLITPGPSVAAPHGALAGPLFAEEHFMRHTNSRLAMELWCHAIDTLLAKGASFADALDGANVILQAHKRENEAAHAEAADDRDRERNPQGSPSEAEGQLLGSMQRTRMG